MTEDGEKYKFSAKLAEVMEGALRSYRAGDRSYQEAFDLLAEATNYEINDKIPSVYVSPDAHLSLQQELDDEQNTVVGLQKKIEEQAKLLRMAEATVEERTNEIIRLEKFLLKAETRGNTAIEVIRILRG